MAAAARFRQHTAADDALSSVKGRGLSNQEHTMNCEAALAEARAAAEKDGVRTDFASMRPSGKLEFLFGQMPENDDNLFNGLHGAVTFFFF